MWQPFAAGAAWALALARGSSGPTECHCTCRCELPDLSGGWGWELVKATLWLALGIIFQVCQLVPFLLRRIWPVIFLGDHGVKEVGKPSWVE